MLHSQTYSVMRGDTVLSPAPARFRFGAFELDTATGELRKGGLPLKLQPQPLRVLQLLVEHAGELVSCPNDS
jgi:DNA-binding response OmpR family regulator